MSTRKPTEVLIKVRLSFPALFHPKVNKKSGKESYGAQLIIDKSDTATVEVVKKAILAAKKIGIAEKWAGKVPPGYKGCLRDGDAKPDADDEDYVPNPATKGCYFFNANNKDKPGVLMRVNGKNVPAAEEDAYPGCYVFASVAFFPYNNEGKGVTAALNNILKVADGPRLDGRRSAEEDFESLDYEEMDGLETADDDDDLDSMLF